MSVPRSGLSYSFPLFPCPGTALQGIFLANEASPLILQAPPLGLGDRQSKQIWKARSVPARTLTGGQRGLIKAAQGGPER